MRMSPAVIRVHACVKKNDDLSSLAGQKHGPVVTSSDLESLPAQFLFEPNYSFVPISVPACVSGLDTEV